jgi:hypothetical protein
LKKKASVFDREEIVAFCMGRMNLRDARKEGQRERKAKFSHVTP